MEPPDDPQPARRFSRRRAVAAAIVLVGAVLGLASCVLLLRPAVYFGTPVEAVSNSFALSANHRVVLANRCTARGNRTFACSVDDNYESYAPAVEYTVVVGRSGCWKATGWKQIGGTWEGTQRRVRSSGCVHLSDFRRVR